MNAPQERKSDFDFKVTLVEETLPSDSNVWNQWTSKGNSGKDAVSCNAPATSFKTMWTNYRSFGISDVTDDHVEPGRDAYDQKLEF